MNDRQLRLYHFLFWINILAGLVYLILQPVSAFWFGAVFHGCVAFWWDYLYTFGDTDESTLV